MFRQTQKLMQLLIVLAFAMLFAFALPILAQGEEGTPESAETPPELEESPSETLNTTAVIIGAFVTVGFMALGVVWTAVSSGKNAVDAAKAGGESAVRGIIGNQDIALWGEERLNHLPESVRRALTAVVDVYDPISPRTSSDLDEKTQRWLRNLLDGDSSTGAVS